MEPYIQISKINDFLFCPVSLYLHSMYEGFNSKTFHQTSQVAGKINHQSIEAGKYSTASRYLQCFNIYSEKYNIMGKIDIYDKQEYALIERKTRIKEIYNGYKYQLYAQYFCLVEMGYKVEKLFLHSLEDNKRYKIYIPNKNEIKKFEKVLSDINSFDISKVKNHKCLKCELSVYGVLSW